MEITRTGSWPSGAGRANCFAGAVAWWRTAQGRRAEARTLAAMSDGELADMSINRTDVARLFDPAYPQEDEWRLSPSRARECRA